MAANAKEQYTRVAEKPQKIAGTTVGWWSSDADKMLYPNYNCKKCQFSTIYAFKMVEHMAAGIHVWKHTGKKLKANKPQGAIY